MIPIELSERQKKILAIVQEQGPITGEQIAEILHLTRATLRPDLAILTMSGLLEARPRVGYFYTGKTENRLLSDHIRTLKVKDYKAPPVVVSENSSAYEAVVTLFLEDVGTLYVLNKEHLLAGVVSRKDLLRASLGNKNLEDVPVGIIMTRMPNVITVSPEESIYDAAHKLIEYQVDSLPVVVPVEGKKNAFQVVGRCTKTTVARAFVQIGKEEWI